MTAMVAMLSVLAIALVGWVVYTNAKDRRRFETDLEKDLAEDDQSRE